MDLPDLGEPGPIRFTGWPDLLSPPNDGDDPGDNDEDWNCEDHKQHENSGCTIQCQAHCCNNGGQKEDELREGATTASVLREFGVALWEIRVHEYCDPDGNREENHNTSTVLLLSEHRLETVGTPEGSDRVACEVDIDW